MSAAFFGLGRAPERACRKLQDWPEADRRLWAEAMVVGDILEPGGARAGYRPISNRKVERGYGRFMTFLTCRNLLDPLAQPADRIAHEVVADYVGELQAFGNASQTILARLQELHEAALVMDPGRDWSWIRGMASRIRAHYKPARDKGAKMVATDDLLALGQQLMSEVGNESTDRKRAMAFRDGLIVTLQALRPMRLHNLAALELNRHVTRVRSEWWIAFEGNETKTGAPLERPWPEVLVPALEEWLSHWRPILLGLQNRWTRPAGNALWISSHGSPMTEQALYDRIVARTKAAFGNAINPHLFRDIAATTLAHADPKRVRIAAQVLGHRNFSTTERHYLHANQVEATRRMQEGILELRRLGP